MRREFGFGSRLRKTAVAAAVKKASKNSEVIDLTPALAKERGLKPSVSTQRSTRLRGKKSDKSKKSKANNDFGNQLCLCLAVSYCALVLLWLTIVEIRNGYLRDIYALYWTPLLETRPYQTADGSIVELGKEKWCAVGQKYQRIHVVGMFNTGTNALLRTLQLNCQLTSEMNARIVGSGLLHDSANANDQNENKDKLVISPNRGGILIDEKGNEVYEDANKYGISEDLFEATGDLWKADGLYWKHSFVGQNDYRKSQNPMHSSKSFRTMAKHTLAVVLVKDPLLWIQSVCRSKYGLKTGPNCGHLGNPRLNASQRIIKDPGMAQSIWYRSLVHYWNDFNAAYVQSANPRLIYRFEDALFDTVRVVDSICDCVGGRKLFDSETGQGFTFVRGTAKAHGRSKTRLRAQAEYAKAHTRFAAYLPTDLQYVAANVNRTLLTLFGYDFDIPTAKELAAMKKMK